MLLLKPFVLSRSLRDFSTLVKVALFTLSLTIISIGFCGAADSTTKSAAQKFLLLDDRIIDQAVNAKLVFGKVEKSSANPLFSEDRPWEPRGDNYYCNVIYDKQENLYKCWYNPFVISELDEKTPHDERKNVTWKVSQERRYGLCYATSSDGIKWDKRNLGLIDYRGSTENNIVMYDVNGPGIIKDLAEADPQRRYKMIGTIGGNGPHHVWYSSDGLRWGQPEIFEQIGGRADTRNNLTWIPEREEWMLISRVNFTPRDIGRSASKDLRDWTPITQVIVPEKGTPDFHDMPSFLYENIYLGLIGVFDTVADRQWIELAWSPDSIKWHRLLPGTPFIANGEKGAYDWGCIFADQPILNESEIRIYYSAGNGQFHNWRDAFVCLAVIGRDRWAGYQSNQEKAGKILTRPDTCKGNKLAVTADALGGSILCAAYDSRGKKIAELATIDTDVTNKVIADVSKYKGQKLRLGFELHNATIYSFAFISE